MIYNINSLCSILSLIVFYGCTERIVFDRPANEPLMVVYGVLTDEFKRHSIELGYAVDYSTESFFSKAFDPITEADKVEVISSSGLRFTFNHIKDGLYKSDIEFAGIPGELYKIEINLNDDEMITSEWSYLNSAVGIDRIELEMEQYEELKNNITIIKKIINILLYPNLGENSDKMKYTYNLWKGIYYLPGGANSNLITFGLYKPCWNIESNLDDIVISDGSSPFVRVKSLDYGSNRRGGEKYVSIFEQFTLGEEAYKFFRSIINNRDQGSVFDKTPAKVYTNISSTGNLPVSGFFYAAGYRKKRVITNEILPSRYNYECQNSLDEQLPRTVSCQKCKISDVYKKPPDW